MTSTETSKKPIKLLKFVVIVVIIFAAGYKVYADSFATNNTFSIAKINFTSQNLQINAKVADTKAKRNQGLMNVKDMPKNDGMIFIFEAERRQAFWMKDTYIPLDMMFISSDLKIRSIHEGAIPLDESGISSIVPVKYVVEVNAGFVKENNIKTGDRIQIIE